MNKKMTLIIAIALVALLIGAALVYRALSEKEAAPKPQLTLTSTPKPESTPAPVQTEAPIPSITPAPTTAPASVETPKPVATAEYDESTLAPDFSMLDADGSTVMLSDFFGKPIVLNFWASWCGPCKAELPVFDAAAEELSDTVQFMMVNLADGEWETADDASRFIKRQGYTFPVFFDTMSEGAIAYSVRSIPETYFIDSNGSVQAYWSGEIDAETLAEGIAIIQD